ncbi:amidase [Cupriavidus sp. P-10]|uniref:amidase n=1 Tax=Cupriavidus sp. P-10 TaxID=2027911 RepID=UPI000E2F1B03|nr:amidase [Cupriavidus sp. P-10]BDB26764.1 amidase [Cupriavidus sp. P-10]
MKTADYRPALAPSPGLRGTLAALRHGRTTAHAEIKQALVRAEACKRDFNAFSVIDWERALKAAADSDRRYEAGQPRPLEGLPIAVKDLIDTRGIETRYGSEAYLGHVPGADAEVVQALVERGAIVVGKTTTHEFAWGVTTASAAFGDTLNPLDTRRIPGGSSGGAAAAIAGGAVAAGLGTDTGGSVRIPAALCGVAGFKPTLGALPTRGIFPLAPTLDHPGLLGGGVDDIIVLAEAFGIAIPESDAWLSARLGVLAGIPPVPPEAAVAAPFDDAIARLGKVLSCEALPAVNLFDGAYEAFAGIVLAEAAMEHFRRNDAARIAASYSEATQGRLALAGDLLMGDYAQAQQTRHRLIRALRALLSTVDYLVLPTCPCLAPPHGADSITIDGWSGTVRQALMGYTAPFNLAGFPAISIPLPARDGSLPAAMQVVARPGDDGALLKIALEIERLLEAPSSPDHNLA